MADEPRGMPNLERALRELQVDWPETPDLAAAVLVRIAAEGPAVPAAAPAPPPRRRLSVRLPVLRALHPGVAWALIVLLVALAGVAATPSARSAVLEWLGLKGAEIERREPDAPPAPARRGALGEDLLLGRAVTLPAAVKAAGFDVVVPDDPALGDPDAVYFADTDTPPGGRVALVYGPRRGVVRSAQSGVGLLVEQFAATTSPVIQKAAGEGVVLESITVDGEPGYFLSGAPHGFAFVDRTGNAQFEDQRLAGNTLLLERRGLLVRIEGRISKDRAIALARSLRPAG